MTAANLRLEWIDPATLVDNPLNWRRHPDLQTRALNDILDEVGWAGAALFNEATGQLIDGHLRKTLATRRGELIPVLVGSWTEEQERIILATLDPIAALADADADVLAELLVSVKSESEAVRELLAGLAEQENVELDTAPEEDETHVAELVDRAAELQEKWGTATGQVWELGKHRLAVGDCRDRTVMERVMGNDRFVCLFTDPPYGVSIGAKNRFLNSFQRAGRNLDNIEADDANADDLMDMLISAFSLAREFMADDCSVFVCAPQGGQLGLMMMMMMHSGLRVRHVLNWVKNQPTFSLGRLDYAYQHEPILFTRKKTHKRTGGGQFHTSVWAVDKPRASADHPTMKPVELPENAIANHTDPDDCVGDIFLGSGTTIIACERLGRRCRAIELDERYAAVCLQRFFDATGIEPVLLGGSG